MVANKKTFTKSGDEVFFVYSVLRRLGCGEMRTFEQRLRLQKVQYIAQLFNITFCYPYNLYVRGPYSPDLTADLFLAFRKHMEPDTAKFLAWDLEKMFQKANAFMKDLNNRELELVATMHWLLHRTKLSKLAMEKEFRKLKEPTSKEFTATKKKYEELCQNLEI